MEPSTQKQQIIETLRQADNVIITTSQNPDEDQVAGAIALTQIMTKLGKRADAVVSSQIPSQVEFLPTRLLQSKFNGIRDFVISLNVSHTEADKLKYVPEGKRLNIYITPFNGNFNNEDVSFHYGDYHCDAVVALGVTSSRVPDKEIADQKQLLEQTRLITLNAGETAPYSGALSWNEPNASSLCELLVSLAEALQSGNDTEISTALLTGIMAKTNHFTNSATTPKVMTMAAQLMAAGAKQSDIMAHLYQTAEGGKDAPKSNSKKSRSTAKEAASAKSKPAAKEEGRLEPSQEASLSHHTPGSTKIQNPKPPDSTPTQPPNNEDKQNLGEQPVISQSPPPAPSTPPPVPTMPGVKPQVPTNSPLPSPPTSSPLLSQVNAANPPPPPTSGPNRVLNPPPPPRSSALPHGLNTPIVATTAVGPTFNPNTVARSPESVPAAAPPPTPPSSPNAFQPASGGQVLPLPPKPFPQAPLSGPSPAPPPPLSGPTPLPQADIDAARKAVEDAVRSAPQPKPPPYPPTNPVPPPLPRI